MKTSIEQSEDNDESSGNVSSDTCHTLLEIYRDFVASAEKISERRQAANQYFLALNTAAIGFVSVFAISSKVLIVAVNLSCFAICVLWFLLVGSYKEVNAAKFKVIQEIECRLQFAPYHREWELLGAGRKYHHFSTIERAVPVLFAVLHLCFLGFFAFCGGLIFAA